MYVCYFVYESHWIYICAWFCVIVCLFATMSMCMQLCMSLSLHFAINHRYPCHYTALTHYDIHCHIIMYNGIQ